MRKGKIRSSIRARPRGLALVSYAVLAVGCVAPRSAELSAFENQFAEPVGGNWRVDEERGENGTRRTLVGPTPGPVLRGWVDKEDSARGTAKTLISDNARLLSIDGLEPQSLIGSRVAELHGFAWSLHKPDPTHGSIAILGARVDCRIHSSGRILLLRSEVPDLSDDALPEQAPGAAVLDQQAASHRGLKTAREPGDKRTARLVYRCPFKGAKAIPVWEVPVSSFAPQTRTFGLVYLSADGSRPPEFVSTIVHCQPTLQQGTQPTISVAQSESPAVPAVTVTGWCRIGLAPDSPPVRVPLANVRIFDRNDRTTFVTSDDDGHLSAALPPNPATELAGKYSGPVLGGVPVLMVGPNGDVEIGNITDPQVAMVTAYYWIEKANRYCRQWLGTAKETDAALEKLTKIQTWANDTPSTTSDSGGYYVPGLRMLFPTATPSQPNMAYSTIVVHEWGHALDDAFGGMFNSDGLAEGWADAIATLVADTPCVGIGAVNPGECLRSGNNQARHGDGSNEHERGQSWMGFAWTLQVELIRAFGVQDGRKRTNRLLLGSICHGAVSQKDAVEAVFKIADENGLQDPKEPIFEVLRTACERHGMPVPETYRSP